MIFVVAFLVFVLDRITKVLALIFLSGGGSVKVLPGIFHLTLVFNNGAAFGLLKGRNDFFILISILIVCAILFYIWKYRTRDTALLFAAGLILGGAAGNLFDRIRFANVIDFLDFRVWPVFNVADSCVTAGILLLAWKALGKKCTPSS
ncbi:MAG: signal peptidase II [Candidatus Omnitrophica bacterium]|nr:signal peptidase II [Candidatus Omnitrophota bacterium]